jgi:hypothetical protein
MKPIVTTMLAHHAQVLVKGHYGFTSSQLHGHSLLEITSCDQVESVHSALPISVLHASSSQDWLLCL